VYEIWFLIQTSGFGNGLLASLGLRGESLVEVIGCDKGLQEISSISIGKVQNYSSPPFTLPDILMSSQLATIPGRHQIYHGTTTNQIEDGVVTKTRRPTSVLPMNFRKQPPPPPPPPPRKGGSLDLGVITPREFLKVISNLQFCSSADL
jgi:hypothetical protein